MIITSPSIATDDRKKDSSKTVLRGETSLDSINDPYALKIH